MHSVAQPSTTAKYAGTPVQVVALIFGIVFLAVGIAGFIPGLTTDVDALLFWGSDSGAMLLGIFQVSILHNIVHLLFGAAGLWLASSFAGSRNYLIWGGVVYGLILVYGLFVSGDHPANVVPVNTADNWLHGALAVAMILLGVLLGRRGRASA
ncbi:DUF4383 domain-containing protein [Agromyces mariniharenae]|uniref:DUF4383 domain-containing protein n=1 Tax=Agromyces mariniharenae TaxID=2604423 RepID=A0A5S4V6Z2_9MICO|nr:DUF4383 domain-containing protein [Agromyces mariniharenae]TYL53623.1 DUF4383 domain-containing protein [Agromyces mariniharenae]HEU0182413.1 DUF4383 domain-containing protein [Agromyces mariniharenae]